MIYKDRYKYNYQKRKIYNEFCDCIRFDIPRYLVNCDGITLQEKTEIWKQAKKDMD